jgi:hypothetical protein
VTHPNAGKPENQAVPVEPLERVPQLLRCPAKAAADLVGQDALRVVADDFLNGQAEILVIVRAAWYGTLEAAIPL